MPEEQSLHNVVVEPKEPDCVVAIKPCCNRLVFAAVNTPRVMDRKMKRDIGKLAAEGCKIDHWPVSQVRIAACGCTCKKARKS